MLQFIKFPSVFSRVKINDFFSNWNELLQINKALSCICRKSSFYKTEISLREPQTNVDIKS